MAGLGKGDPPFPQDCMRAGNFFPRDRFSAAFSGACAPLFFLSYAKSPPAESGAFFTSTPSQGLAAGAARWSANRELLWKRLRVARYGRTSRDRSDREPRRRPHDRRRVRLIWCTRLGRRHSDQRRQHWRGRRSFRRHPGHGWGGRDSNWGLDHGRRDSCKRRRSYRRWLNRYRRSEVARRLGRRQRFGWGRRDDRSRRCHRNRWCHVQRWRDRCRRSHERRSHLDRRSLERRGVDRGRFGRRRER